MIANEDVNCDNTEAIEMAIQEKLNNVSLYAASIKSSDHVVMLNSLTPTLGIGDNKVLIDPLMLFSRLIASMQRYDRVSGLFKYELSFILTSLFKDNMMQYPSNFSLVNALDTRLLEFTNQCDEKLYGGDENGSKEENYYDIDDAMSPLVESVSENDEIVLDSGYLFYWTTGSLMYHGRYY